MRHRFILVSLSELLYWLSESTIAYISIHATCQEINKKAPVALHEPEGELYIILDNSYFRKKSVFERRHKARERKEDRERGY